MAAPYSLWTSSTIKNKAPSAKSFTSIRKKAFTHKFTGKINLLKHPLSTNYLISLLNLRKMKNLQFFIKLLSRTFSALSSTMRPNSVFSTWPKWSLFNQPAKLWMAGNLIIISRSSSNALSMMLWKITTIVSTLWLAKVRMLKFSCIIFLTAQLLLSHLRKMRRKDLPMILKTTQFICSHQENSLTSKSQYSTTLLWSIWKKSLIYKTLSSTLMASSTSATIKTIKWTKIKFQTKSPSQDSSTTSNLTSLMKFLCRKTKSGRSTNWTSSETLLNKEPRLMPKL